MTFFPNKFGGSLIVRAHISPDKCSKFSTCKKWFSKKTVKKSFSCVSNSTFFECLDETFAVRSC